MYVWFEIEDDELIICYVNRKIDQNTENQISQSHVFFNMRSIIQFQNDFASIMR